MEKQIVACPNCRQKMRVAGQKRGIAVCPTCGTQSEHDLRPRSSSSRPSASPHSSSQARSADNQATHSPNSGSEKGGAPWIGIVISLIFGGLLLTGNVFFTTDGCTLPLDLVIGDTCMGGSFVASAGLTLGATLFFGLLAIVGSVIFATILKLFRKS